MKIARLRSAPFRHGHRYPVSTKGLIRSSDGRGVLQAYVRAAGYEEYGYWRAADDLGGGRAEKESRHGPEAAGSHHQHLALFPPERVQRVFPVAAADDPGLHLDVV